MKYLNISNYKEYQWKEPMANERILFMKRKSGIKIFTAYLKEKKKIIAALVVFVIIFYLVFYLYHAPIEAVEYASLLCFVLGSVFLIVDFIHMQKKYADLVRIYENIDVLLEKIPKAEGLIEECYQEMLYKIADEKVKLISKADEEKTDLLDYYTLWVHQIKTPIAAMNLLLETEDVPGKSDIRMELFQIEQYVEMVLHSLRLFSDTSDFVLKRYQLEEIVRQAVRKHAKIFIGKKIRMDFRAFSCEVLTDEKWLLFVIEQILSNALKYTKTGTISVYLDEKEEKTLVIEDTGIGIYPEDLPRVCEKGFTGYNGRNDKKSTGIGLYLCKQILDKMSHTIKIESEVGKGTKVKIGLKNTKVETKFE